MASSAIEIRSPAVSSMSSSRPGGTGLTWLARSSSSSVVSPIAETITTTSCPALRVFTIRSATRLMRSALATDEPPYFCTINATETSSAEPDLPAPPCAEATRLAPTPPVCGGPALPVASPPGKSGAHPTNGGAKS